jgi:hypothetical protein
MPGPDSPRAKEATCSHDAVVEAEIRNSSRLGSQAPNAPPALTFGLTGKQMVKMVWAGCVLIRILSGLPKNRWILPKLKDFDRIESRLARTSSRQGTVFGYFCVRLIARSI